MPPFNILIIGGGLGGLAAAVSLSQAGHSVTVLESTANLQTIGGGISIPPNSARVWDHLGLLQRLREAAEVNMSQRPQFKRYNGEHVSEMQKGEAVYGYDTISIHRGNLQALLVEAAREAGAKIEADSKVVGIDESGPSPVAVTKDGRRIKADLIIGADGVRSSIRHMIHPNVELMSSIDCFRTVIDGSILEADPELAPLLDRSTLWWGPNRTVVGIPMQDQTSYSLECAHQGDTGTAGDWRKPGDVEVLKATFADWEAPVRKLLTKVKKDDLLLWKLNQLPELETWVFKSGKVVLLGDAAHAVLPFSGQGHAMAIEDSASLTACLSRCSTASSIPQALSLFETIRKPRLRLLAKHGLFMAKMMQLPDGEEQQKRDAMFRSAPIGSARGWDGRHVDEVPGLAPDPLFWPYVFGHDVVDFTRRRLDELWVPEATSGGA